MSNQSQTFFATRICRPRWVGVTGMLRALVGQFAWIDSRFRKKTSVANRLSRKWIAARTGREFECESERRRASRESGQVLQKWFFLANRFARVDSRESAKRWPTISLRCSPWTCGQEVRTLHLTFSPQSSLATTSVMFLCSGMQQLESVVGSCHFFTAIWISRWAFIRTCSTTTRDRNLHFRPSGEKSVESCHVSGCHGFFGPNINRNARFGVGNIWVWTLTAGVIAQCSVLLLACNMAGPWPRNNWEAMAAIVPTLLKCIFLLGVGIGASACGSRRRVWGDQFGGGVGVCLSRIKGWGVKQWMNDCKCSQRCPPPRQKQLRRYTSGELFSGPLQQFCAIDYLKQFSGHYFLGVTQISHNSTWKSLFLGSHQLHNWFFGNQVLGNYVNLP